MAVEVKRNWKRILVTVSLGVLAIPVLWFMGQLDRTTLMYVVIAVCAAVPFEIQSYLAREQFDGSFEFFSTLPVSGAAYAGARWCVVTLSTLPLAVTGGSFIVRKLSTIGLSAPGSWTLLVFPLVWLLSSGLLVALAGVVIRFGVQQFVRAILALFFLPVVAGWIIERLVPDPVTLFFRLLPSEPHLIARLAYLVAATIAAGLMTLGFWWTKQGFDRFRPRPDLV